MKKINVAELLKDCPAGMELDCTIFENLEFDHINKDNGAYNIICRVKSGYGYYNTHTFTEYGCYSTEKYSKCVIFPKGKTTWEGFVPPCKFEDGDIIALENECGIHIFIYNHTSNEYGGYGYHVILTSRDNFKIEGFCSGRTYRPATEKEKEKLFDAIKANGYKWNAETKTLEKLPKFKVGDRIRHKASSRISEIIDIIDDLYILGHNNVVESGIPLSVADSDYELITKFDINTLLPFESRVLVRDDSDECWIPAIWAFKKVNKDDIYSFIVVGGNDFVCCIPYDDNQHLLGTTDDCDEYYKTWE